MQCQSCGVDKDPSVYELYPYPESERICDDPVPPLFDIDCQPYDFGKGHQWKKVTVCHHCFEKLDPDMWISRKCWEKLNPLIPFDNLPNIP